MQAPDEHTKAYQNSMNERVKRRTAAAGPSRTGFHFQDRKPDGLSLLGPPGSQDLEERLRCLQEEDPQPLGCKCRNSRCLKLYCVCFAARKFCDGCACIDCGNTEENVAEVHKRRHKVNVKNPHAFQDKKNPIVAKGCNCLKSRCLKGYCECYAAARGCMPICCCKDCENVYGVRPGIDDQILGHRRVPLFNYDGMVESDEEGSDPPPGRCVPHHWPEFELHPHGHAAHIPHTSHAVHATHALNAAQAVRAGRPAASDSSEPPHQDLLNLVAAAEQLERDTGLEIPYADTGDNPRWHPPGAGKKPRKHAVSPDGYGGQRGNHLQPLFKSTAPAAKRSTAGAPPRRPTAAPVDHSHSAKTGRMGGPQRAAPHGEQSAIRSMHAKLLHRVTHRPHQANSLPGSAHEDGSPLEETGLVSPIRSGKGGATPHPVKLVRSPEGLHLTVASAPTSGDRSSDLAAVDESNPGGSDAVGLLGAVAGQTGSEMIAAHLSTRRRPDGVTTTDSHAHHTSDTPMDGMHAARCKGPSKEGPEDEELHGMLSFPSAEENNALGAAQAANNRPRNADAANGTEGGVDIDSCTALTASPIENVASIAPGGLSDKADTTAAPKTERNFAFPEVCEQGARGQDSSTGSKLQALLVTMIPCGGSDESGLYCSIPVALPPENAAAGATSHTTLLVPCHKVPPGAKHGQQQFRVQLQSVDLSVKDLELMCKSSDTAEQPDRARQSDEMTQSGMHAGRRQSQNVAASNAMRAGDNASQHSGDESPWGHRSPGIAPGGPACSQQHPDYNDPMDGMFMDVADDMHSKDLECQDADKDERRFRSARLQKRAEREGPRLTQVEFDDAMLTTNKRRRMTTDAQARPDILSGIIGKRVVVPRRSRSALPASQLPVAMPPPLPSAPTQMQAQQPAMRHQPSNRTTDTVAHAGKSPAPKDEEQFAVMGLLSLCKAN